MRAHVTVHKLLAETQLLTKLAGPLGKCHRESNLPVRWFHFPLFKYGSFIGIWGHFTLLQYRHDSHKGSSLSSNVWHSSFFVFPGPLFPFQRYLSLTWWHIQAPDRQDKSLQTPQPSLHLLLCAVMPTSPIRSRRFMTKPCGRLEITMPLRNPQSVPPS